MVSCGLLVAVVATVTASVKQPHIVFFLADGESSMLTVLMHAVVGASLVSCSCTNDRLSFVFCWQRRQAPGHMHRTQHAAMTTARCTLLSLKGLPLLPCRPPCSAAAHAFYVLHGRAC
jgi:hypothetical protein